MKKQKRRRISWRNKPLVKMALLLIMVMAVMAGCAYGFDVETEFNDLNDLCYYVHSKIEYVHDWDSVYDTKEYFQSPMETESLKTGDCEDFTIYFMYVAEKNLGIKPDFAVVKVADLGYHALAKHEGFYYDSTTGIIFESLPWVFEELFIIDYDTIMLYSTALYTKTIDRISKK